ncbi:PREDICTED: natterin-3-like, partial [Ficedula albicollis]|uniref:natterin-3-like n=1 Tax=Ficedula albicollis TaxID=59894 RepID=UPI0007AD871F
MAPLQFLALLALGAGISGITEASPEGKSPEELPAPAWLQPRSPGSPPAPSWLLWVPFRGQLPADAVSSWNRRSGRPEFVCSARTPQGCNPGSFDPARGAFCSYTWAESELHSHSFHLLVNPGAPGAPEGAVEGCPLSDLFVGRSADGLGKASKEQQALFVAVDGEEVWYKWYQVLVVRQGPADISIANVSYDGSAALDSAESAELAEVLARNDGCQVATESVSLKEETEVEHGWSAGEFVSRVHRVSEEIPARSECAVVLRGLRREIRVPFSAWLTREFRSGRPHRALVAG